MKAIRVILVVAGVVGAAVVVAKKYLSPGVYIEEVPSSPRPIEGVGTSTAARVSDDPKKPRGLQDEEPGATFDEDEAPD